ncbi:MAG: hypothetical protein ACRD1N_04315 [Terriglobia bacterium]
MPALDTSESSGTAIAPGQFVDDIDQSVQALVGMSLAGCELSHPHREFVHALCDGYFSLGEAANQVGKRSDLFAILGYLLSIPIDLAPRLGLLLLHFLQVSPKLGLLLDEKIHRIG